jgi:hypothetical protein
MMYRDGSGRVVQLADSGADAWKADLSRTYAMAACACPPPAAAPRASSLGALAPPAPALAHRELFRMILANIRCAHAPSQSHAGLLLGARLFCPLSACPLPLPCQPPALCMLDPGPPRLAWTLHCGRPLVHA